MEYPLKYRKTICKLSFFLWVFLMSASAALVKIPKLHITYHMNANTNNYYPAMHF